jgi:hypothetical protein
MMKCAICEIRRPRRYCPGVRGEICTQCCGAEREVTVDCPLDCVYLQEARKHDRIPAVDPDQLPNQDVRITETFLEERKELIFFAAGNLLEAVFETPGAVDYDIREALDALIRTYRTLESGLVYETRPNNPLAAAIQQRFRQAVEEFRRSRRERLGMETTRDTDILGILVFLQRIEIMQNNGRKRGRAFIDFLRREFRPLVGPGEPASRLAASSSPLIVPGAD